MCRKARANATGDLQSLGKSRIATGAAGNWISPERRQLHIIGAEDVSHGPALCENRDGRRSVSPTAAVVAISQCTTPLASSASGQCFEGAGLVAWAAGRLFSSRRCEFFHKNIFCAQKELKREASPEHSRDTQQKRNVKLSCMWVDFIGPPYGNLKCIVSALSGRRLAVCCIHLLSLAHGDFDSALRSATSWWCRG